MNLLAGSLCAEPIATAVPIALITKRPPWSGRELMPFLHWHSGGIPGGVAGRYHTDTRHVSAMQDINATQTHWPKPVSIMESAVRSRLACHDALGLKR